MGNLVIKIRVYVWIKSFFIFPENAEVPLSLILTQWQPRCKGGLINIHHMPPNEVNRA